MQPSYKRGLENEKIALTKLESICFELDSCAALTRETYRKELIQGCRLILAAVKDEIRENEFMQKSEDG